MVPDSVRAGSVVWYDWTPGGHADDAAGLMPGLEGRMPALVVSPVNLRRIGGGLCRTAYLVPLSPHEEDGRHDDAVEIVHGELNARSGTGRTFALCNLAFAAALDSDRIEIYRGKLVGNRQFALTIEGEQLDLVLGRLMLTLLGQRRFRRFTNGYLKALPAMIRKRQELTRVGGLRDPQRSGHPHKAKRPPTKRKGHRLQATPQPVSPRPSRPQIVRGR